MRSLVSIIIVNYNSGELLYNCLRSIRDCLEMEYEVIVVDNASTDTSLSMVHEFEDNPSFRFIKSEENLGFAKGCNLGATLAKGAVFHFLNPDTELQRGMDRDYLFTLRFPDKVYVTPLLNRDASLENGKMVLPLLKDIFWWNVNRKRARFWCKGASVIIPKNLYNKVGGWSEDYFMYGEDLDLFYNFWRLGINVEILHTPVFHFGGGCSKNVWNSFEREVKVQRSFKLFYSKYFPKWKYVAVKCYFLLHNLLKHPSKVKGDIKAWKKV